MSDADTTLRRGRGDRAAGGFGTVLMVPVLLLGIALVIQYALTLHAKHLIQAAAQDAALDAAVYSGGNDPTTTALTLISDAGGRITRNPTVTIERSGEQVTVLVSAGVMPVVPFLDLTVTASAAAPIETFTAEPDR